MININASFTVSPLISYFQKLAELFQLGLDIREGPYNQIHQELLNPNSPTNNNSNGVNLYFIRWEDWLSPEFLKLSDSDKLALKCNQLVAQFIAALKASPSFQKQPSFIIICPQSLQCSDVLSKQLKEINKTIISELQDNSSIRIFTHDDIAEMYSTEEYRDPHALEAAHIPYTQEYYASLALFAMRKLHNHIYSKFKVIVVDCDNTLWNGVCAESTLNEIKINKQYKLLQETLIDQYRQGKLICLSSKNHESDVWNVFDNHPDMILKREHITCYKINWDSKSINLLEISDELELGLNSFIFIDDNPVECEEVTIHCPSILTWNFPKDFEQVKSQIKHAWYFDKDKITNEDIHRTIMYKQQAARNIHQQQFSNMEDFINSLNLELSIEPIQPQDLERASQLTFRTNQFNSCNSQIPLSELASMLNHSHSAFILRAKDKFGDYGLIGLVLYQIQNKSFIIDGCWLSCRILGKGVEHRVINFLGKQASQEHCENIVFRYKESSRNLPVYNLLSNIENSTAETSDQQDIINFTFSIMAACNTTLREIERLSDITNTAKQPEFNIIARNQALVNAQIHLHAGSCLINQLISLDSESHNTDKNNDQIKHKLHAIWKKVLLIPNIRYEDSFFDLSGESLKATLILIELWKEFGIETNIRTLFSHPSIEMLADYIKTHNQSKDAPIEALPENIKNQPMAVSHAQARLWYLFNLENEHALYNMFTCIKLVGKLNHTVLEEAFVTLVERHPSLRTVFKSDNGHVKQIINPLEPSLFKVAYDDMSSKNLDKIYDFIHAQAETPFDLDKAPLIKLGVIKHKDDFHYLYICMHHIISDGWSYNLFIHELSTVYNARLHKKEPALAELSIDYADYSHWHNQLTESKYITNSVYFWQKKLLDAQKVNFPRKPHHTITHSSHCKRLPLKIDSSKLQHLKTIAKDNDTTLYTILISIYVILVSQYSSQDDVVIGTPVHGRNHPQTTQTIGFFINLLALRFNINPTLNFDDFVKMNHRLLTECYEHQEVPFERVVSECHPNRHIHENPITQIMFVFQNHIKYELELDGIKASPAFSDNHTLMLSDMDNTKFDLTLYLQEYDNEIEGLIEYNSEIFYDSIVRNFIDSFSVFIDNLLDCYRDQQIMNIPFHDHKLFTYSNQNLSAQGTVLQDINQHALSRPNHVAIHFEDDSISYQELDKLSDNVCHYLLNNHVPPGELIAIHLPRGINYIVTILGVMKAGCAFLPIDVNYPMQRKSYILNNSRANYLIHSSSNELEHQEHVKVYDFNSIREFDSISSSKAIPSISETNLAYVIYTSGSTGEPKGVMINHSALSNLSRWHKKTYEVCYLDKISVIASLGFDASVWEILPNLAAGTTLYVASRDDLKSELNIIEFLIEHDISISFLPTSILQRVIYSELRKVHSLRYVLTGGEQLFSRPLSDSTYKLFNHYGPTENCVVSTFTEVLPTTNNRDSIPSIGTAIDNVHTAVLNKFGMPLPQNIPGQLYLWGENLSTGYLHNEEATLGKFKAITSKNGEKIHLYKTGDIVYLDDDNNLHYLGRDDFQLKIRGYRIDLTEIEFQALRCPLIKKATVLPYKDNDGELHIKLFFVPFDMANHSSSFELKKFLKSNLPEYMIPKYILRIADIPLTENRKVDSAKLIEYAINYDFSYRGIIKPATNTEVILSQIFSKVLNIPLNKISMEDSFFELGGHSLKVIELITDISKHFSIELQLQDIFNYRSILQLAEYLDGYEATPNNVITTSESHDFSLVRLSSPSRQKLQTNDTPLVFIHPVGGTLYYCLELIKLIEPFHECYGIQYNFPDKKRLTYHSVQEIAAEHIKLILNNQPEGPYRLLGHSLAGIIAIEIAQQLKASGYEVSFVGLLDTWSLTNKIPQRAGLMERVYRDFENTCKKIKDLSSHSKQSVLKDNYYHMQQIGLAYEPMPIEFNIDLFKANELYDELIPIDESTNYWGIHAKEQIKIHTVSGNHETMLTGKHARKLASAVLNALSSVKSEQYELT